MESGNLRTIPLQGGTSGTRTGWCGFGRRAGVRAARRYRTDREFVSGW